MARQPWPISPRGKDEGFVGISLKELSLFLPLDTPVVDNLTVSGRDLLIGVPFGMQGEIAADFSKDYPDSLKGYVTVFQPASSRAAATSTDAACGNSSGFSCSALNTATSPSIDSATTTTTRKRDR